MEVSEFTKPVTEIYCAKMLTARTVPGFEEHHHTEIAGYSYQCPLQGRSPSGTLN